MTLLLLPKIPSLVGWATIVSIVSIGAHHHPHAVRVLEQMLHVAGKAIGL